MLSMFPRKGLNTPTTTTTINKLSTLLSPLTNQKLTSISKPKAIKMQNQTNTKRPTCPNCSKPLSTCLCMRLIKTHGHNLINNKVHVTILQHSLEKKHPLNSAKIAKIGMKNVDVVSVSDVLFEAQFVIRPLGCMPDVCGNVTVDGLCSEVESSRKRVFGQVDDDGVDSGHGSVSDDQVSGYSSRQVIGVSECAMPVVAEVSNDTLLAQGVREVTGNSEITIITVGLGQHGKITSLSHPWKLEQKEKESNIEHLVACEEAKECLTRGFTVKKLQTRRKGGSSVELEQFEEFDITVPPGSVLLFPGQKSVPVEAVDFPVNNLIVLDGTWAKANRMYSENPWLRFLPCVRLDVEKASMFSEVRHQPKPGYLSTIESIVYALEALGDTTDNLEGLRNLLDVFQSMVEDQRRHKDERLKKLSAVR